MRMGCYAAIRGTSLPTFRDNLMVPFSRVIIIIMIIIIIIIIITITN